MELFVGTSGYSYKEWRGSFYPHDLTEKDMLHYYAGRLTAVEINNTFYRLPKQETLNNWAESVPETFKFVLKASRKITHSRPLKEKESETEYLLTTARTLGSRLGAILFQLPPYLHKNTELLENFLQFLPDDIHYTFEFRHRTWFTDEIYDLLGAKNCALCCSDTENSDLTHLQRTANWGYLRLRRPGYTNPDLQQWSAKITSQNWQRAFVFFKHEAEGSGPRLARTFIERHLGELK